MYHHVLFDLDGTVVDSGEGIIASVKYALAEMEIDEKDDAKLKQFVGPPLALTFRNLYQLSEERAAQATRIFREYYDKHGKYQCALYDGIEEVLKRLRDQNRKLIIATSKPTSFTNDIAYFLDIARYFYDIVGSNLDNTRSKKDEILEYIANKNGDLNKSETVMIGDTVHDKIGAEQAGIPFIGVAYGYGFRDEDQSLQQLRLAKTPLELLDLIE